MARWRQNVSEIGAGVRAWTLLLSVIFMGCTSPGTPVANGPGSEALQRLLDGRVLQAEAGVPWTSPRESWMDVNDDMRAFLHAYVPEGVGREAKLRSLVYALTHPGLLGIDYDPQASYTAADAFLHQRANCLSFSALFIALAREVGLKARFNEVEVPPDWDMLSESTFVRYLHINVLVNQSRGRKVIDLNVRAYKPEHPQLPISDRQAEAQYFNNRAMQKLGEDRPREAFPYLQRALTLAPDVDYLWNNLGSIYRRAGFLNEAEMAFLQAIQLNRRQPMALSNLARLYQQRGDLELAAQYSAAVQRYRLSNPYYRYHRARQALQEGDYPLAREHIQYAIRKEPKESRFYRLAADIYRALGFPAKADNNRRLADQLGEPTVVLTD